MSALRRGVDEGYPYSLSRWTDLPAAKWDWFRAQIQAGFMTAMDPKTGLPDRWSLAPVDTLGMVFWTRNCELLVRDADLLNAYSKVVHFTLTGWREAELRAPGLDLGLDLLTSAVERFGISSVTWRFSPVPLVPDVLERFIRIATKAASLGLRQVYVAFLQENDWQTETRSPPLRRELLRRMQVNTDLDVVLCNDDPDTLLAPEGKLRRGVCEDGSRFSPLLRNERCGCALAVDPFTLNEACRYGCRFCYAGNRASASKKRNTTRLTVLRRKP